MISNFYDLLSHFVDNIFKRDWVHFCDTVKWFKEFQFNTHNSIQLQSFAESIVVTTIAI